MYNKTLHNKMSHAPPPVNSGDTFTAAFASFLELNRILIITATILHVPTKVVNNIGR